MQNSKTYSKTDIPLNKIKWIWFHHISHQIYLCFSPKWFHSTKMWRTVRIHCHCSHWGAGSFFMMYECIRWVNCAGMSRQFHPSCIACRRTANLPGLAWQNEACSQPHHFNHLAKWKKYTGTPNLAWCNPNANFASVCLYIASNTSMARYPTKRNIYCQNLNIFKMGYKG